MAASTDAASWYFCRCPSAARYLSCAASPFGPDGAAPGAAARPSGRGDARGDPVLQREEVGRGTGLRVAPERSPPRPRDDEPAHADELSRTLDGAPQNERRPELAREPGPVGVVAEGRRHERGEDLDARGAGELGRHRLGEAVRDERAVRPAGQVPERKDREDLRVREPSRSATGLPRPRSAGGERGDRQRGDSKERQGREDRPPERAAPAGPAGAVESLRLRGRGTPREDPLDLGRDEPGVGGPVGRVLVEAALEQEPGAGRGVVREGRPSRARGRGSRRGRPRSSFPRTPAGR